MAVLTATLALAACSVPLDEDGNPLPPPAPRRSDLEAGTVQLYQTGDEASLAVTTLSGGPGLTLEFDVFSEGTGRPLEVSFQHYDGDQPSSLLPTEVFTAFERDDLLDYRPSGATAIPYVHYEYSFPNASIGFRVSGAYRVTVSDPDGGALFSVPFYVSEETADVELAFGATLLGGGSIGTAIQPAARVRPGDRLRGSEAYQFTVCFARDGRLGDLRCAPEPALLNLSLFQFFLPRDQAFTAPPALYGLDLGLLATNIDIVDVDRAAQPPTALLDLDYAEFGGDVREGALTGTPLVESAFRDAGRADTDAEYVDVSFQFVPPGERPVGGPLYVRGSFDRFQRSAPLTYNAAGGRYEGIITIKQGAYVYTYDAPRSPLLRDGVTLGQPSLYTAFVFFDDPTSFAPRLVAVQTGLAR